MKFEAITSYRQYLRKVCDLYEDFLKGRGQELPEDVTPETLLADVPVWLWEDFVWPQILLDGNLEPVYHWRAGSFVLIFERAEMMVTCWDETGNFYRKQKGALHRNDLFIEAYEKITTSSSPRKLSLPK